jgi:putative transposase
VRALRERGRQAVDEQSLFDMVNEQRRDRPRSGHKTKAARKSAQRIAYALIWPPACHRVPSMALPVSSEPEDSAPIVPFQIEERL